MNQIIKDSDLSLQKLYKNIRRKVVQAIFDYKLIEDNDKILIGISGGKDSLILALVLKDLLGRTDFNFQLKAIHIMGDFGDFRYKVRNNIIKLMSEWNIALEVIDVDIVGRLKTNKDMNCYWCSQQRRITLIDYASTNNYTKIAFGHHLNDINATLLMNIFYTGQISSMTMKMKYDKFPFEIIRPLGLTHEDNIIKFWEKYPEEVIVESKTSCDFVNKKGSRKTVENLMKTLEKNIPNLHENILNAESNINHYYLNRKYDERKEI